MTKLTPEQKIANRKKIDSCIIPIRADQNILNKINKISSNYTSRNKCILDLITTHPDFLKMFPKKDKIKLSMEQLLEASK